MIDAFSAFEDEPRWLAWRQEQRGGRWTKVPYDATRPGQRGDATDPSTWATRTEAEKRAKALANGSTQAGIGIPLGDLGDNTFLCGLDLDSSIDENGALAPWAVAIISLLGTYAETSPSGRGIKAFFYVAAENVRPFLDLIGVEPASWGCKRGIPGLSGADHGPGIECYFSARYFVVTTRVWSVDHQRIVLLDWSQLEQLAKLIPPPSRASSGDGAAGNDKSRSAKAWRRGAELRRQGCTFDEMCEALANDPDAEVRDWVRQKGEPNGRRELKRIWARSVPAGDLPLIRVINGEHHHAADAGLGALAAAGVELYRRDRSLAYVAALPAKTAAGDDILLPQIIATPPARLRRALEQSARWEAVDRKGQPVRISPPMEIVLEILALPDEWPFAPLNGVITCPTLRPDGSLLLSAGYDDATGLYLTNTLSLPPIPSRPTRDDAMAALRLLDAELLGEFPFADQASRSVALSMLLTAVARGGIGGPVPAHAVTAPAPGSGKTYLVNLVGMIATGRYPGVIAVDKTIEETEKRLHAAMLAGRPIIFLDNVRERLRGAVLCQAIEQPTITVRPLGRSDEIDVANVFTVVITGNNLTVSEDLVRRTLNVTLDADSEHPETRTFKRDPIAAIEGDRGRYVAAALTIPAAYIAAGMPGRPDPLPSFGGWSDRIRAALIWLDCPDPVMTMDLTRDADPAAEERHAVFIAWADELGLDRGFLVGELVEEAEKTGFNAMPVHPQLREALLRVAADHRNHNAVQRDRLRWWLNRNANTIGGRHKLICNRSDRTRPRWVLVLRDP